MTREQQEVREKTDSSKDIPFQFSIDLNGPFILHRNKGGIMIYAPPCPDHFGNLLTDTNDVPIYALPQDPPPDGKGWAYTLEFTSGGPGNCSYSDPTKLVKVTAQLPQIPASTCSFVFSAPLPDVIVPLHPEPIWLHKGNATKRWVDNPTCSGGDVVKDDRARGLRLIFTNCTGEPSITFAGQGGTEPQPDFSKVDFSSVGMGQGYKSMSLRFAANRATADDHEQDAYICFQTMRQLVSATDPSNWDIHLWRVDFDNSDDKSLSCAKTFCLLNKTGRHPNDCGALALVIQDTY